MCTIEFCDSTFEKSYAISKNAFIARLLKTRSPGYFNPWDAFFKVFTLKEVFWGVKYFKCVI